MFKLQLQWNQQGEWIDTVFTPRPYDQALALFKDYSKNWEGIHNYRIISTGASAYSDTPLAEEVYGG